MAFNFPYQPLAENRIRLVNVEPGLTDGHPISCSLFSYDRSSISYAALSYTWGDSANTIPIILNGEQFPITVNLWSALQVLRRQGREWNSKRLLWIDAICINQIDHEERAQQVQLMKSIYTAAHHVFIWLGNYSEAEDALVEFPVEKWGFASLPHGNLETTKAAFKLVEQLSWSFSEAVGLKPYLEGASRPSMNHSCWGYLSRIFQRSWFLRLWVIQELAVARKAVVYCGDCMTDWQTLEGCVRAISAHIRYSSISRVGQLPFIYNLCHQNVTIPSMVRVDKTNLLSLIYCTRYSKASEPLDRLYAIKDLLDVEDPDISVDYSVSVASAYRKWTIKRIKRTGKLDVLSLCTNTYKAPDNMQQDRWCSWVPDITDITGLDDSLFALGNGMSPGSSSHWYKATADTRWESPNTVLVTEDTLSIKSIKICHIIKLFPPAALLGIPVISSQLRAALRDWEEKVLEHFGLPITQEPEPSLLNAFVSTIFRGQVTPSEDWTLASFQDSYKVWRGISPLPQTFEPAKPEEERSRLYLQHFETMLALMIGNTHLCITSEHSIGVISSMCDPNINDEIHVLFGGNTPFLLRRNQNMISTTPGTHRLMGPCYLHGYMYGEAITALGKGERESGHVELI
ncbi:ankyrin and HET domain-containing protein [Phlyctema vagabunda]|uniref:Ankyrin and HET domain-containing protein n=1 Tax=Phlyctema vagabunda TaxID=108571 RepID=A0ABR4PD00_9HELO